MYDSFLFFFKKLEYVRKNKFERKLKEEVA